MQQALIMTSDDKEKEKGPSASDRQAPHATRGSLTSVCDYLTLEQWRVQVIEDSSLSSLATLILIAISYTLTDDYLAQPIPRKIWEMLAISDTAFYIHLRRANASGYLRKAGEFEYQTASRPFRAPVYELVFPQGSEPLH